MNSSKTKTEIKPEAGRILIVDDEEIVNLTLKRLLEPEGYTIDSAYGGIEALAKINAGYDLLILDIRMPDLDGIEVLRELRKRQLLIEVIILTGYATLKSATQALNYGARGYLMKPIDSIPEFKVKIREAIHVGQLARQNRQFYDAIVSGQVDSLPIDGKLYQVPALGEEIKEFSQRLMGVIRDAVVLLDFDGNITFANVNFAQMLGESYQDLLGSRFESYVVEEARDKIREVFTRLSSGEVAVSIPAQLKTSYGSILSVIISSSPIYYQMEYRGIAMVISDITEISRVTEKVEFLANLVENAQHDMMFIVNSEGQIMECNSLARSSFGHSRGEMLGLNMGALFKSRADEGWEKIVDAVKVGLSWRGELIAISKDEKEFPVEITVSRPASKADSGGNIICFVRNLTERKRAEEALRESEEKYRTLFQESRDAIFITTRDGKLVGTNPAFLVLFGYTREEAIGMDVLKTYVNPDDRLKFQQEMEQKGAVKDFELRLQKKDGTELDCLLTATVRQSKDGVTLGYQGLIRDITELKQSEEEIRKEKGFSENIIATVPESLLVLDKDFRIKSANRTFYKTFQTEPGKVIGSSIAEVLHDEGELTNQLTKLFGTEDMLENFEMPYESEELGERLLNITARGMCLAEEEEEEEELVVIQDITERKQTEEQVQNLIRNTLDAQEAEREHICLEVHDGVTQTLASAFQYLQTIESTSPNGSHARQLLLRASSLVKQGIQESREVINSLQPATLRDLGLVPTLRQEMRQLEQETRWEMDFKADAIRLPHDIETGLYRIIHEAITNARKHADTKLLRIRITTADDQVKVEVRDWGVGFNYNPGDISGRRSTGLLSMRKRAELLQGTCDIQSGPGQGTTVRVEIPFSSYRK